MTLPAFQLDEPIITAMVGLLQSNLPAEVTALNATITDGYIVDQPAQYLDYVPVPSTLEGGMPIIGVRELPAQITDDLQINVDALHHYVVTAIIQNTDQRSLTWQMRRTIQAVANVIQADRILGPASVMRQQSGVWSVQFEGTDPGPLFGDPELDSTGAARPPTSFISYSGLLFHSTRTEV